MCCCISGHTAEIIQLAASSWDGKYSFNQYVLPKGFISAKSSEITGLTINRVAGRRTLLHHGRVVESHPMKDTLLDFLQWLNDCRGMVDLYITKRPSSFSRFL